MPWRPWRPAAVPPVITALRRRNSRREISWASSCSARPRKRLSMGPPRKVRLFYHAPAVLTTWVGPRKGPHTPNVRAAPAKPGRPSSTVRWSNRAGDGAEPVALIAVAGAARERLGVAGDQDGGALDGQHVEAQDERETGVTVGGAALQAQEMSDVALETPVVGDRDEYSPGRRRPAQISLRQGGDADADGFQARAHALRQQPDLVQ